MYRKLFNQFFQIISVDYVDHYKSVPLYVIAELYYINLINLWFRINFSRNLKLEGIFQYKSKKFSVKKGTLSLRWVSSPGPFDCRSNVLSSELRSLHNFSHKIFLTPILQRMYRELFNQFFQIISVDYVDHYKSVPLYVITELYYIDLINLWFRINFSRNLKLEGIFQYKSKRFSVKEGTLSLRCVSSPGHFDRRSNALSSEIQRFHNFPQGIFLTPIQQRMYRELFNQFFQIISVDYVDHYKSVPLYVIAELYYINLINLWFRINFSRNLKLEGIFQYKSKKFSVKKGTL